MSLANIVGFYRDCYKSDFKAIDIPNFFSSKVELPISLDSLELITSEYSVYPVETEWAKSIEDTLVLDSKEKSLFVGCFFVKGRSKQLGKSINMFAPLLLFEASVTSNNDVYMLEVNMDNPIVNPSFYECLASNFSNVAISLDDFVKGLPKGPFNFDTLVSLKRFFEENFASLNVSDLDGLLRSYDLSPKLESISKSKAAKYKNKLIPGLTAGLFKKPTGSLGIINELDSLKASIQKSRLLTELFYPKEQSSRELTFREILVPTTLSESQKKVFYALDKYNLTMVTGPPGTGKSFTIAALATELISDGRSVLIASKNDQGGKVIAEKIENDLGLTGILVKTVRKAYRRGLRTRLRNILNGYRNNVVPTSSLRWLKSEIAILSKQLNEILGKLREEEYRELSWGRFYYENRNDFFSRLRKKWIEYKSRNRTPIWKLKLEYDKLERKRIDAIRRYVKVSYDFKLFHKLKSKRKDITLLLKAWYSESGNVVQENFGKINFNLVLSALPAWVTNVKVIADVLPLEKELFDVLIIDEASQCDIASAIPLLYRAKKAVIVGDSKQLRHVSFLSRKQEDALKLRYGITDLDIAYRNMSILDLVDKNVWNQNQVVFLDEHYRSSPDIIAFSNAYFYDGYLKIMTASPVSLAERHVFHNFVKGQRDGQGSNILEASSIVDEVLEITRMEVELDEHLASSIGIVSPFRAQVSCIMKLIKENLSPAQIKKHKVLIGTPFHFQGEERDLVFISFVIDNNTHHSVINYLNNENVLNVTITRARYRQFVFISREINRLKNDQLLTNYLSSISQFSEKKITKKEEYDEFLEEVIFELRKLNIEQIFTAQPMAGLIVDIVVVYDHQIYCIDLIGYPGQFQEQFAHSDIQMLNRMQHRIFFLPYSTWCMDRLRCVENLENFVFKEG